MECTYIQHVLISKGSQHKPGEGKSHMPSSSLSSYHSRIVLQWTGIQGHLNSTWTEVITWLTMTVHSLHNDHSKWGHFRLLQQSWPTPISTWLPITLISFSLTVVEGRVTPTTITPTHIPQHYTHSDTHLYPPAGCETGLTFAMECCYWIRVPVTAC